MFRQRQEAVIEELPDSAATPAYDNATLRSEAARGTAAARQVLSTAYETRAVGVSTAERLRHQTRQLENVVGSIEDTRENLDHAEITIEKLTRPAWRRIGGRSGGAKKKGKTRERFGRRVFPGREKKESDEMVQRMNVVGRVDGYEEFDGDVRQELIAQDELLSEAGVVVEELRVLAVGIGEEIEKEAEIVEGIDVIEVTSRIRENNRKLRTRLKLKG